MRSLFAKGSHFPGCRTNIVSLLCLCLCRCLYQCRCRCLCLCLCMLIWKRRKRQKKERKWWKKRRKINKQQQQRLKQFHNIRCIHLRWCLFFISFIRICWYARAAFFYFITHARMYIFTYTFFLFLFCSVSVRVDCVPFALVRCPHWRTLIHLGTCKTQNGLKWSPTYGTVLCCDSQGWAIRSFQ